MSSFYIMKDGLYLKISQVRYESDYWEIEEIYAETRTQYSWTSDKDEAMKWLYYPEAATYLAKRYKQSFFRDAEVVRA